MSADTSLQAARRLLENTKLRKALTELPALQVASGAPPKPSLVVKLTTATTVAAALRELAVHNVLSAPVSDSTTNEFVGLLDVMDVLAGLLARVYPELMREGYVQTHKRLSMMELQAIGIDFGAHTIATLLHGGDLWYKGDRDSTLYEVVASGFRVGLPSAVHSPHHHLKVHHRIAVFDILPGEATLDGPIPEWRVTDIVSQTDILRFLAAKMDSLAATDPGMTASLADHGLVQGAAQLATVSASTPALTALVKLQQDRLSAVAVIGGTGEASSGRLLANLSASDVRGITPERFGALALPVGAFLLLMRPGGGGKHAAFDYEDALLDQFPPAVAEGRWGEALAVVSSELKTCTPATPLRTAIEAMVRHGKHRLYICEESGTAVGVVTPTDVLRAVVMSQRMAL